MSWPEKTGSLTSLGPKAFRAQRRRIRPGDCSWKKYGEFADTGRGTFARRFENAEKRRVSFSRTNWFVAGVDRSRRELAGRSFRGQVRCLDKSLGFQSASSSENSAGQK